MIQELVSRQRKSAREVATDLVAGTPRRRSVARSVEQLIWGGQYRERFLTALLQAHYRSVYRRQWSFGADLPHYFDHRIGSFAFAMGAAHPYAYYRGFFAAELIREGSMLLDIGCGDGFFARRFFAPKCAHVDAIDVDSGAIEHASRRNAADNVTYSVLDAVRDSFPRPKYDVIVLDGALGHFASADAQALLHKIQNGLVDDGVFVGSESLGQGDVDHQQSFHTLGDFALLLGDAFRYLQLRELEYAIPSGSDRREAFWRCSNDEERLAGAAWQSYTEGMRTHIAGTESDR